jgi:hypothetical protein
MTTNELVLLGAAGGVLPDVLRMIKTRFEGMPAYIRTAWYWISLIIIAGVGALTVYLLKPTGLVEVLAVGFSAPEILTKLLSKSGDRGVAGSVTAQIRSWWAE